MGKLRHTEGKAISPGHPDYVVQYTEPQLSMSKDLELASLGENIRSVSLSQPAGKTAAQAQLLS